MRVYVMLVAAKQGRRAVVDALIRYGADISAKCADQHSLLTWAIRNHWGHLPPPHTHQHTRPLSYSSACTCRRNKAPAALLRMFNLASRFWAIVQGTPAALKRWTALIEAGDLLHLLLTHARTHTHTGDLLHLLLTHARTHTHRRPAAPALDKRLAVTRGPDDGAGRDCEERSCTRDGAAAQIRCVCVSVPGWCVVCSL